MVESGHLQFNFGKGRERYEEVERFLEGIANEKSVITDPKKIHPDMPYDANLMQYVDEFKDKEDTVIDSISWYRIDPENLQTGVEDKINEYLGIDRIADVKARKRDYRDMINEAKSNSLDIYSVDGFTEAAFVGDKKAVNRAKNRLKNEDKHAVDSLRKLFDTFL
jgi:hypothetical protein